MRYQIMHWITLGHKCPLPGAEAGEKIIGSERYKWYINLEPDKVLALSKEYDVMIREVDGETVIYLDDKGRRFRMR